MPSSVCAQTMAISATEPLVIHILEPFKIQSSPDFLARVFIDAGSEPAWASVKPKQPITSPRAIGGDHFCFCSSEPKSSIGYIHNELCTEAKLRKPLSPRSNS